MESRLALQEFERNACKIRRAQVKDAAQIYDVKRQAWIDEYPNEALGITEEAIRWRVEGNNGERIREGVNNWRRGIISEDGKQNITYVAEAEDLVMGFMLSKFIRAEHRIASLYVLPQHQGKGIGSKLMQRALDWHGAESKIGLCVLSYNQRAISFYNKFGFVATNKYTADEPNLPHGMVPLPQTEMIRLPKIRAAVS